jgi:hypothetical protein
MTLVARKFPKLKNERNGFLRSIKIGFAQKIVIALNTIGREICSISEDRRQRDPRKPAYALVATEDARLRFDDASIWWANSRTAKEAGRITRRQQAIAAGATEFLRSGRPGGGVAVAAAGGTGGVWL